MRPSPASLWLGLLLGAGAACYDDDYLLGALCRRDSDCGEGRCCAGQRCRALRNDDCALVAREDAPFLPAYMPCDDDDTCIEHSMPRCVLLPGAAQGFCADYCVGDPSINCSKHPFGAPLATLDRTCIDLDGQSLCALDCSLDATCPDAMQCLANTCVPAAPP